jgi:hypothetical protein
MWEQGHLLGVVHLHWQHGHRHGCQFFGGQLLLIFLELLVQPGQTSLPLFFLQLL